MKLFPHILVRISGGPFQSLESLNLVTAFRYAAEINHHKKNLERLKLEISDALFKAISVITDPQLRTKMIHLRRDVFNERRLEDVGIEAFAGSLPSGIGYIYAQYVRTRDAIAKFDSEGESVFREESAVVRKNLARLASEEKFQKGLLLSSQSLLKGARSYITAPPEMPNEKEVSTEEGLIKYISRMYAKTSPFSTFTNLARGRIDQGDDFSSKDILRCSDATVDPTPVLFSHIRLNNYLYQYLQILLVKNLDIARHLRLRPNPTLKLAGTQYIFLTNFSNIESFQQMETNPALELLHRLFSTDHTGGILGNVVSTIVDNKHIDAPAKAIEAYILQLVDYGFLEYNFGVSGIDPDWNVKLEALLETITADLPLVREMLDALRQARQLAVRYEKAGIDERKNMLDDAYTSFRVACLNLHKAAGLPEEERLPQEEYDRRQKVKEKEESSEKIDEPTRPAEPFKRRAGTYFYFKPEQMFYEDTTINTVLEIDRNGCTELIDSLHGLLQQLSPFEWRRTEQETMLYYFVGKYGADAEVDLLDFYEDYYREFKKPQAEKQEQGKKQKTAGKQPNLFPPKLDTDTPPSIRKMNEQKNAWEECLTERLRDSIEGNEVEVHLTLEPIRAATDQIFPERKPSDRDCSYGAFIQPMIATGNDGSDHLMAVVTPATGFGKMISRFLHLFEPDLTADIRAWNASLARDTLFMEDTDGSFFNANLHPPLMPFEIWIPGGQNSMPTDRQVPITSLHVRLASDGQQLALAHTATHQRAYAFDLGFQGQGRSQLFNLLEKFSLAENMFFNPIFKAVNAKHEKLSDRPVRMLPRIVFNNRLILHRQTWFAPKKMLPLRAHGESAWSYYCRITEWRTNLGLPEEIFVFVKSNTDESNADQEQVNKPGRDDYKPQYINFNNPLLVHLFSRLAVKITHEMRIEEMLPGSGQLLSIGASRYVTEFIVQWYTQRENATP